MDNFKERFIAEALEWLSRLEKNLLLFEVKPKDKLLVEEIFRILHTLKGSCGMYGFEKTGQLIHLVENIYDKIQKDELKPDTEIINLTFETIDFTGKILRKGKDVSKSTLKDFNKLTEQIKSMTGEELSKGISGTDNSEELKTYYIYFFIDNDFEKRSVNIESLIKKLGELGTIISIPLEASKDITKSWEIFLVTKNEMYDIEDIFIFMSDLVKIEIIGEGNLFLNSTFDSIIKKNAALKKKNDIVELTNIINNPNQENSIANIQNEGKKGDNFSAANSFLRVSSNKLDEQMDLLSELVTSKAELRLIVEKEKYLKINKIVESIDKITNRLRKNILNIRLVQVNTWYIAFYRLVRDISKQLNKDVELIAEGLDTEIDKNIIDKLEGPLTHLIRNSLDHGIENPEEREKAGKSRKGTITLKANQAGLNIIIQIKDDGRGIDVDIIKKKAISKGIISSDNVLSEKQVYDLIFLPGFSTAQNLSQISGRGVGMDVVKKAINQLRGEINIQSALGKGTDITIKLPMMLSIIDTLLIKTNDQFFAIPLSEIYKCSLISKDELEKSDNNQINIGDQLIPYINLRNAFSIPGQTPVKQKIVIVKYAEKLVGFVIDEVIGEYQAVLKPFDGYFVNQSYLVGASLLADGNLCMILDTAKLIEEKISETLINEPI
jgi:two-component system chemotaxis sensor kinase CheA